MISPKRFDIFPSVWDAQKVYTRSDFSLKSSTMVVTLGQRYNNN